MTTAELDRLAEESIRAMGGIPTFIGYHGYAHSICASVNEEVVHGIPGPRVLRGRRSALDRHRHDPRRLRLRLGRDGRDRQRQPRRPSACCA